MRRFTLRDLLLGVQITLCALLVTASLVSLRGMVRSLHAPIGFEPEGRCWLIEDLQMAGYSDDSAFASPAPHDRRSRAHSRGHGCRHHQRSTHSAAVAADTDVYREGTADLRPSNSVTDAYYFSISPGYLAAAQTRLLSGRDFTWDDGPKAPKVAIINETFAHRMFGNTPAVGRHFLGATRRSIRSSESWKTANISRSPKIRRPPCFSRLPSSTMTTPRWSSVRKDLPLKLRPL